MTSVGMPDAWSRQRGAKVARALGERAATLAPMFVVIGLAIVAQAHLGATTDVSWLITLAERTLDGEIPYVDFLEPNPPASILLYVAPAALARLTGATPEFMVAAFGFTAVFASVACCAGILARAGLASRVGPAGLLATLAILLLLPARTFDQRDHIALIACLPFMAVCAARAEGRTVGRLASIAAGLGAAAMLSIRPHCALAILAPLGLAAGRRGWRILFNSPEIYAAGAGVVVYGLVIVLAFPVYLEKLLPMVATLYVPIRQPAWRMLIDPGFICWSALACALWRLGTRRWREPIAAIPALASAGALASFFIQAKGWPYHIYPAVALMALALALALGPRLRPNRAFWLSLAGFLAGWTSAFLDGAWPIQAMLGLTFGVIGLVAAALLMRRREAWAILHGDLLAIVAGAAAGVGAIWFAHGDPRHPQLEEAVRRIGPHPSVLEISGDISIGHPLVRQLGGVWAQRVCSLWITAGADHLLATFAGDAAAREAIERYRRLDRTMLTQDIARNRPDAILVSIQSPPLSGDLLSNAEVVAALADYRLAESVDIGDDTVSVYARRILRPGLDEH